MEGPKKLSIEILHATDYLKKLILDNPKLPLLILAGEDANYGEYCFATCSTADAYVGEVLNCMVEGYERCYTDRDKLEEDLKIKLYGDFEGSDNEFKEYFKKKLEEYDPYWEKCIILYVDN